MKLEHTVVIQRPVEEVFALVANPDNDARWGSLIVASRQLTPGTVDVGTTFEQTATFMGARTAFNLEVTRFEADRAICYRVTKPVAISHCRTFEPAQAGTQLTFSTEVTLDRGFRLSSSLMARMGFRQMEEDLKSVKTLLESSEE